MKNFEIHEHISPVRILIKASIFFGILNFAFILLMNIPIGKINLYNSLFEGRPRLPFGENPSVSYNLSLYNLDAMLASHKISSVYSDEEVFKVFLIGDSSIWGFLQRPDDTLAGILNSVNLSCCDRKVVVYNLGYPSLSVLKDLMIIEKTREFDPDLIVWMVTLESLPLGKQIETPLVENNPMMVNQLITEYELNNINTISENILDYTLISRKRELADILRLQIYGVMWDATGIDQEYPENYTPALREFEKDYEFYSFEPFDLDENGLAINVITQAIKMNEDIEFVVVNEPILISRGENSDIRYNYYYPCWAYDQYRIIMQAKMDESGIKYYDFWDLIPESEFTNSAIHLNKNGEEILAKQIAKIILDQCSK